MEIKIRDTVIKTVQSDITLAKTDAIVNAANSGLMGGGGVDGAIHRAGGPAVLEQCVKIIKEIGSLPAGQTVITGGGSLSAKYIIHTVGPVWKGGDFGEEDILKNAYYNSLVLGSKYDLHSIAFPAISTGVYGYPSDKAGIIAVNTVIDYIKNKDHSYKLIVFVLFKKSDYDIYENIFKNL